MGAAIARKLRENGFEIAVLSPSGSGEKLGIELGGFGVTGTNESSADIERLLKGCVARWGRIDVLVNGAGHGPKGPLLDLTDDDWQAGMDAYLMNVIRASRLVIPQMLAQQGGAIINISSFGAVEPDALYSTSSVFRAALAAFTKMLSTQHASNGVRINNVLPGFVNSKPAKLELMMRVPMRRYADVVEVAELVAFLASERAQYITGQNLRIDGGLTHSV